MTYTINFQILKIDIYKVAILKRLKYKNEYGYAPRIAEIYLNILIYYRNLGRWYYAIKYITKKKKVFEVNQNPRKVCPTYCPPNTRAAPKATFIVSKTKLSIDGSAFLITINQMVGTPSRKRCRRWSNTKQIPRLSPKRHPAIRARYSKKVYQVRNTITSTPMKNKTRAILISPKSVSPRQIPQPPEMSLDRVAFRGLYLVLGPPHLFFRLLRIALFIRLIRYFISSNRLLGQESISHIPPSSVHHPVYLQQGHSVDSQQFHQNHRHMTQLFSFFQIETVDGIVNWTGQRTF